MIATGLAILIPIGAVAYLAHLPKPESKAVTKRLQHQTWRQKNPEDMENPPTGIRNSENTFAFWQQQPFVRPRQQNFQFHEAEAVTNYHELHSEISAARENGDSARMSYLLANYFRTKDTALQSVIGDYARTEPFIQVRRIEGNRARLRTMRTIADDPKLEMASRTVPHLKEQPIQKSMTKSYFRPVAYHVPYYELQ